MMYENKRLNIMSPLPKWQPQFVLATYDHVRTTQSHCVGGEKEAGCVYVAELLGKSINVNKEY